MVGPPGLPRETTISDAARSSTPYRQPATPSIFQSRRNKMTHVHIYSVGDDSVGIPETHWEILDVYFDQEYREQFREALTTAFEYVADPVRVIFSDDLPPETKEEPF
jgi:hypothetical protein